MQLSRFSHVKKIKDDIYGIYNSLIMDIIYVDEKKLSDIKKFNVSDEEINTLKSAGIYTRFQTR